MSPFTIHHSPFTIQHSTLYSLFAIHPTSQPLYHRTPGLGLEAPFHRTLGRPGLLARRRRRLGGPGNECDEPCPCIGAVLFLGAKAASLDDDDAFLCSSLSGKFYGSLAHTLRQAGRIPRVEAQLYGGRHLVNVLAAGAGRADKALFEVARMDDDIVGNNDFFVGAHVPVMARRAEKEKARPAFDTPTPSPSSQGRGGFCCANAGANQQP